MKSLRIASRKSSLARLQTYNVANAIKTRFPEIEIEFFFSESLGDKNLHDPLWKMPEKGVFTSDFTTGLIEKKYDLVVHSWKDLPIEENLLTEITATLDREPANDLLLTPKNINPKNIIQILSSSPRREYNLSPFFKSHIFPNSEQIIFRPVRGNIQTRVRKLFEENADGLVVAFAALRRLLNFSETQNEIADYLQKLNLTLIPITVNPPAAAQGALALEVLKENMDLKHILSRINNSNDFMHVQKERQELKKHGGGCHQKIGVYFANLKEHSLKILKGLTKENIKLDEVHFEKSSKNYSRLTKLWSESISGVKIFDKTPITFQEADWIKDISHHSLVEIMISHPYVLSVPQVISFLDKIRTQSHVLFTTSSLNCWKKMNDLGHLVYASSEGLGLTIPHLSSSVKRYKLSHFEAKDFNNNYKLLPCYKLQPKLFSNQEAENMEKHLLSADGFFWTSYTQFSFITNKYKTIISKNHFCGPGSTYDNIKHHLENVIGHSENLCSYLNEEAWIQAYK